MRILVTGASGFVGKAIVENLAKFEHDLYGTANNSDAAEIETAENLEAAGAESDIFNKKYRIFKVDITDAAKTEVFAAKLKEIQMVVHCAGLAHQFGRASKNSFWKVNVTGTKNILELAAKTKTENFILISSVAVYGQESGESKNTRQWAEDRVPRPRGFYAESKFEAEKIAEDFCRREKINLTILRPATVIGEEDRGNFRRLIEVIDRRRFIWVGRGENRKSLVHREDVARACAEIIKAKIKAKKNDAPKIYNIAAPALTMNEIVTTVESVLGRATPPVRISPQAVRWLCRLNARTLRLKIVSKIGETTDKWLADEVHPAEKFEKEYDFEFLIGGREAIRREVEWYRNISGRC